MKPEFVLGVHHILETASDKQIHGSRVGIVGKVGKGTFVTFIRVVASWRTQKLP